MQINSDWTRRHFLRAGCLGATAAFTAPSRAQQTARPGVDAIPIGAERQLFIDDLLLDLDKSRDVTRTLNSPQSIHRVLKPDQPWEALGFTFYCGVVDDGGALKLFHGSYDAEKKKHFSLATSTDGIHWERPQLELKAFQDSTANNILPIDAGEVGVFLDPHAPPEKRYRLILTRGWPDPARAGIYVASSPDGIQWTVGQERVLPFVPDSQPSAVWDERLQKYAIYLRSWNPDRVVARVEVADLESPWPYDASVPALHVWGKDKIPTLSRELPTVMACDEEDPKYLQLYTSVVSRYPFAPGTYMAFPAAFQLYKGPEWEARAITAADGPFDTLFASSRDGITWNRWRRPYIATGFCEDLNLKLVSMGEGIVRRGNWLYQYFVGWPYTHGQAVAWERDLAARSKWIGKDLGGIYCATQRVDGFVSMDTPPSGGAITTRPLFFKGDRLRLNLHTAGSGSAKVALLDSEGNAIPGFGAEDCETIETDALDHEVRWKAGPDVSSLADKPIRFQCTMRNAKFYALQFGGTA
jgi:hypothetical protein